MTSDVKVSANEWRALQVLADGYNESSFYFRGVAQESGLPLKIVRRIVRSLARKGLAEYNRGLFNDDGQVAGSGYGCTRAGYEYAKERNEKLFTEAAAIVVSHKKVVGTTSFIQRKLGISYNEAARITEQLERRRVISWPDAKGVRTINPEHQAA